MYGQVFITAGTLTLVFGGPGLLWMGLIMLEIGLLGFKLHILKEAQRVGFIKIDKELIVF